MSDYLIRVELHHEDDYTAFHAAMARRGFTRTIAADDGKIYDLPAGSYHARTERDSRAVHAAVASAAAEVQREADIVVARTREIVGSGLKPHVKTLGEMAFDLVADTSTDRKEVNL